MRDVRNAWRTKVWAGYPEGGHRLREDEHDFKIGLSASVCETVGYVLHSTGSEFGPGQALVNMVIKPENFLTR
jgi:hypothetical protein